MAACGSNGSERLRYRPATDGEGAPCLNWRGENRCAPKQSAGPQRGYWQRADLMLPPWRLSDLPDPKGTGARALVHYCSTCHNLPSPGMHAAADWKPLMERMRVRMAQAARYGRLRNEVIPGDRDVAVIETYLKKNALAAIGVHELPEPGTLDAQAFQGYCGVCHALPKPNSRTAESWPPIADRMFRYLANSEHARGMSPKARDAVVRYLQRNGRTDRR